ncbi:MAG: hypothetical protein ABSH05_23885 [Bryobacteraceae bacterium]
MPDPYGGGAVSAARLVAICAAVLSQAPAPAQSKSGFEYNGIIHVSWWYNEYTYAAATTSRQALATTHANWASVLVTWYQSTITSTSIAADSIKTPTDDALRQAIQELHNQGLKVMLKPHVDLSQDPNHWRGEINPADRDAWFASYKPFILKYAQMAQDQGVEGLCIGTELIQMSGTVNRDRWNNVIDAIRAVYSGVLTYAANATSAADEFTSVSFWEELDLIGLDGYFPLTNHKDPSLEELVAAWQYNSAHLNIVAAVENLHNTYPEKPVIFTEIGYRSASGANTAPYSSTLPAGYGGYDLTEQRNCYEAFYEVWSQQASWVKGVFWWAWPVNPPGANDTDYNPRGKPAEEVLRTWQGPPESALNAVVSAADYRADGVAPGAIVSLWGTSLASGTITAPMPFPLPTSLGDTRVTFGGIPAPLFFVSPGQVNAQAPFEVPPGSAVVEVTSNLGAARMTVTVAAAGPGIFTRNMQGTGEGAILDAVNYRPITAADPAEAGEWIQIYCTGLGAVGGVVTTGDVPPMPPPETVVKPEVRIDGQPLVPDWAGLAPGWVGLYAVNVKLPSDVSAGTHQLQIAMSGAVSNTVTFSVR